MSTLQERFDEIGRMTDPDVDHASLMMEAYAQEIDRLNRALAQAQAGADDSTAAEADGLVNGDRNDAYGPPEDAFIPIAAGWTIIIRSADMTNGFPPELVAPMMVWMKTCRQLHRHKHDNLVDIHGYTDIWERMIAWRAQQEEV